MNFISGYIPPSKQDKSDLFFIFEKGKLLVKKRNDEHHILNLSDLREKKLTLIHQQYFGCLDHHQCYAAEINKPDLSAESDLIQLDLRALIQLLDEDLIWIAGRANQLVHWNRTHQYCGNCGSATEDKVDERAKYCSRCNLINYPRLSPAVIMAVIRDNEILLARNHRFKGPFFSVLAGFVEVGETLEECVRREIMEEVGIRVKNIRYFGSQPWPFPDSLMIAFTAEYDSGEICVDQSEIIEAAWYEKDTLPRIPPKISIARQLIDWFVHQDNKR